MRPMNGPPEGGRNGLGLARALRQTVFDIAGLGQTGLNYYGLHSLNHQWAAANSGRQSHDSRHQLTV